MKPGGDTGKNDVLLFLDVMAQASDVRQPSPGHLAFRLAFPRRRAPRCYSSVLCTAPRRAPRGLSGKGPAPQNEKQGRWWLGWLQTALSCRCGLGRGREVGVHLVLPSSTCGTSDACVASPAVSVLTGKTQKVTQRCLRAVV